MSAASDALRDPQGGVIDTKNERLVIFASSLGTVFEWYDFYLVGSLAAVMAINFFSGVNETTSFILTLLMFAAGFAVRPFGAIFFGRLGDLIGRKHTFLITIVIMGLSTFIVGILPTYAQIGIAAPIILVGLRLLQGLALGGEYGGAATYVAEHAPMGKRGLYTSWIQTTATLGLFLSLIVILLTRQITGAEFNTWGWRIPFLISIFLLGISVWIRLKLNESPVFKKMKEEGKASKAPLKDAFGNWENGKTVLMALLGGTAGQAVVWYTGQFYALFFLIQSLKIDGTTANYMIAASLVLGTPFFIFFGWLSDKVGRKSIVLAGCLLAALTFFPAFKGLTQAANPAIFEAQQKSPVTVLADPADCHFQFDPTGTRKFTSQCDMAKAVLAKAGVPYHVEKAAPGPITIKIGNQTLTGFDGKALANGLTAAGYPAKADPARVDYVKSIGILWYLVILVTMVYGPIAAWLVELFPTRIRYTSMSLPYHIGNGWFGGFLPTTSFAMVAATGDIYYGLWYPVVVALMTFVLGLFFLPETYKRPLDYDAARGQTGTPVTAPIR
ncbi:MAG: MFS transporter [Burkholderiaceae bacterium]